MPTNQSTMMIVTADRISQIKSRVHLAALAVEGASGPREDGDSIARCSRFGASALQRERTSNKRVL
jgi:hypothetical protein